MSAEPEKSISSIATTYLLCRAQPIKIHNSIVVNLGLCGAPDEAGLNVGDLAVINQIIDHGSGLHFFPDMILKHDLCEHSLETFDYPVTHSNSVSALVDMEAAGFYVAASYFVKAHQILCIKLVSDKLEGRKILPSWVTNELSNHVKAIENLIRNFLTIQCSTSVPLSASDQNTLIKLEEKLRFSVTQRKTLEKTAENFVVRQNENLSILLPFLSKKVNSKYQVNKCFHEIITVLTQS